MDWYVCIQFYFLHDVSQRVNFKEIGKFMKEEYSWKKFNLDLRTQSAIIHGDETFYKT